MKIGVLVMAYGSPEKKEDILPYYTDIRRGRAPTPELLAELEDRYEAIGGISGLNTISRSQIEAIARLLAGCDGDRTYHVYMANKHWHPRIPDVVKQAAADGMERLIGFVLAPQGGKMASGSYFDLVDQVLAALPAPLPFTPIPSWHLEPGFIEALAENVAEGLTRFPEASRSSLPVIFTTHSLPERILTWHDPYPTQLREMGAAVTARLGLKNVDFAFQSAGRTSEPWLGPEIRDKVKELAAKGFKEVLVAPTGFIADHLEVRYDLDIELRQMTDAMGIHFERIRMMNDNPKLMATLANMVRRYARGE